MCCQAEAANERRKELERLYAEAEGSVGAGGGGSSDGGSSASRQRAEGLKDAAAKLLQASQKYLGDIDGKTRTLTRMFGKRAHSPVVPCSRWCWVSMGAGLVPVPDASRLVGINEVLLSEAERALDPLAKSASIVVDQLEAQMKVLASCQCANGVPCPLRL